MSFHQKVSLPHVIDLFILLVVQRNLMRLPSVVYMTKHFALEVDIHWQSLCLGNVRYIIHIV